VKERDCPTDKVSNYRGITLNPVISKMPEVCLCEKLGHFCLFIDYSVILERVLVAPLLFLLSSKSYK
jgi:hypothetical protein